MHQTIGAPALQLVKYVCKENMKTVVVLNLCFDFVDIVALSGYLILFQVLSLDPGTQH